MPKRSQEPPKRRPRCAKNRPRAAPEASWKRPLGALGRRHAAKHPQTPSRPRFWTILETIWKDFGIILDRFFEGISNKLDRYSRNYPLAVLGGCAPPDPPLLRGTHGGGNAACRAKDNFLFIKYYISSARQAAFPPPCVPLSRGGSGGAQPPQHCKRTVFKVQFHVKSSLQKL